MIVEALGTRIPFKKRQRAERPKPFVEPERRAKRAVVIGNVTGAMEAQAREAGAEIVRGWYTSTAEEQKAAKEKDTGKRKRGKGRVSNFANKAILHTFEQSHRQRMTKKAAEAIHDQQNLQTEVHVPRIRTKTITAGHIDGESRRAEHEANQDAKTKQIETQYKEGINLGSQENGTTIRKLSEQSRVYQDLVEQIIKPLVTEDGSLELSANASEARRQLETKVLEIISANESNTNVKEIFSENGWVKEYRMVATNLLQVAEAQRVHKDEYANDTRNIEDDIDIVIANLQSGARTGVSNTWVDKVVNTIQTKLGGVISPGFVATGSAATIMLSQRGIGNVLRATKDTTYVLPELLGNGLPVYLAVPALIAGGIATVRHRREENIDKELHGRQDANGETIDRAGTKRQRKRREKLQTFMHHGDTTAEALVTGQNRGGISLGTLRTELMATGTTTTYDQLIDRLGEIYARRNLSDTEQGRKGKIDTIKASATHTMDQGDELLTAEIAATRTAMRTQHLEETINSELAVSIQKWEKELQKGIDARERKFLRKAWARSVGVGVTAAASAVALGTGMRYGIKALQASPDFFTGLWDNLENALRDRLLHEQPKVAVDVIKPDSAPAAPPNDQGKDTPGTALSEKKIIRPGKPQIIAHDAWGKQHASQLDVGWYENNTPNKSDYNEVELHNKRVGEKAVRWDVSDMTNKGSFSNNDIPRSAPAKDLAGKDTIYYRLYGANDSMYVKSNSKGGGFLLDQMAKRNTVVNMLVDGVWKNVPQADLAQYAFGDLGNFKANSDFTHHPDKFNVNVSAGTMRVVNGEYVFQSFATVQGDGEGQAIKIPTVVEEKVVQPPPHTEDPAIPPGTEEPHDEQPVHDPDPTAYPTELIDFGIPVPIAPRLAPGPMIPHQRTRITPSVNPDPRTLPGYPLPGPIPAPPPRIAPVLMRPATHRPVPSARLLVPSTGRPAAPEAVILAPHDPRLEPEDIRGLPADEFLRFLSRLVFTDEYGLEKHLVPGAGTAIGATRYYILQDSNGMNEKLTADELKTFYLKTRTRWSPKPPLVRA